MTTQEHLEGLGKVIGNLLTLELMLRVFLCEAAGENLDYPNPGDTHVDETHLTNRKSLKPIIVEYNSGLNLTERQQYAVDLSVVEIRDALAHGRIASSVAAFPATLYKFGDKDQSGKLVVERVDVLDKKWFSEKRILIRKQIDAVVACSKSRAYKMIAG
jgi:hypothetical protein